VGVGVHAWFMQLHTTCPARGTQLYNGLRTG